MPLKEHVNWRISHIETKLSQYYGTVKPSVYELYQARNSNSGSFASDIIVGNEILRTPDLNFSYV